VAPLKKNEKNPLLSPTMLINRFERSCGTFGEEKKPNVVNNTWLTCLEKKNYFPLKKNDHGVDVNMIIVI
jgi:hypothetical protein